jgi:hypothetical protein
MERSCPSTLPKEDESFDQRLKKIESAMSLIRMRPENVITYEKDGDLFIVHVAPSTFSLKEDK